MYLDPYNKIVHLSKFKAVASDKINVMKLKFVLWMIGKHCWKRRKCWLSTMFLNRIFQIVYALLGKKKMICGRYNKWDQTVWTCIRNVRQHCRKRRRHCQLPSFSQFPTFFLLRLYHVCLMLLHMYVISTSY